MNPTKQATAPATAQIPDGARYLTTEQAATYSALSDKARAITDALQSLAVEIVQSPMPDADKIGALNWLSRGDGLNGFAHALHPQSEWQGGEAWKLRRPTIARACRAL